MYVRYDSTVDALYVSLRPRKPGDVARTDHPNEQRHIDYGADNAPLGVEFLDASEGIDLRNIPDAEAIAAALQKIPRADGLKLRSASGG